MPALMPTPAKANTPVMGMEPPITMSSPPAWARAASGAARLAPAASSRLRRREEVGCCCIACLLLLVVRGAASIAEGPQVEEAAQAPPHLCEPLRLEDQKDDDQQPEHHGAHGRQEDGQLRAAGQQVHDELEQLRDHGRSEEHTSELQSPCNLVCRLLLEKKKKKK